MQIGLNKNVCSSRANFPANLKNIFLMLININRLIHFININRLIHINIKVSNIRPIILLRLEYEYQINMKHKIIIWMKIFVTNNFSAT